ncbi:MAG: M20/M25/M40 family metallo-hydrolase, partial [Anderseniella sp.]|nr:M20/M25/M40 family metallo-hydrolase [Anderseniella sp.]
RGTADMKGFIACCLVMAPRAAKLKDKLTAPIHFAFSYDEEIGCVGVRRLIDLLEPVTPRPRCCIIGEPTLMQVVTAHKGKAGEKVRCTGLEAHSSLAPTAINAVHLAIDLINEIRAIQAEVAETGLRDGDYDVAYTTLHAGNLHGGETLNIVPNLATFEYEIRHLPADDPAALVARIHAKAGELVKEARKVFPGADISFQPGTQYPALDTPPDSDVVNYVKSLTGGNSTGKIAFGTEGGLFQNRLGIPTVVCGPGSIAVAHKPDEYIAESEMAACDKMLGKLVEDLSTNRT